MPDLEEMAKKRIVYTIPNMEQIQVQKNITYKTVDGTDLKMDVYYPTNLQSASQRPAVILVHG
jgi:acetyl esterase/lipase